MIHICGWDIDCFHLIFVEMKGRSSVFIFLDDSALMIGERTCIYFVINEGSGDREENLVCVVVLISTGSYGAMIEGQFSS